MKVPRPSHATVVAYLALFASLGGSAYAVSQIGTNNLKDGAVTSPKIKRAAVRGPDVKAPIVRTKLRTFGGPTVGARVEVRCKANERFLSGGGGWETSGGTLLFSGPSRDRPGAPAKGYFVFGETTTAQALEADAVCLPK